MTWSSAQYARFEAERTRPVHDLVAQLPDRPVRTAIDLGCGPGNSTEVVIARYPDAVVTGLDSSADMVASARARLPGVRFVQGDIAAWAAAEGAGEEKGGEEKGGEDLVFANAALQWVPDHASLLPALLRRVAPGGCLAVQVPDNLDEPAHRLMREVAAEGAWAAALSGASAVRGARQLPDWYYRTLVAAGAGVDLWRTEYVHRLADHGGIIEWFRSTGLRPFLQPLEPAMRADFLDTYLARLRGTFDALPDGTVLLPFPRLFFIATPAGS